MENVIAPLASLLSTSRVQVQSVAEPDAVLAELAIASDAESVNVHVGAVVTSLLDLNVKDNVSPSLPSPVPPLAIAIVFKVGCVLSIVIVSPPVAAVTGVPALPFESL
jgi:hypothetical protein